MIPATSIRIRSLRAILLPFAAAAILSPAPVHAELVVGSGGAVAAEHIEASRAGVEVLDEGGNAIDAAVAAVLATGVVNPSSSGLGGGGFMVIFLADDRQAYTIDFRESAPAAAYRDMFVVDDGVDADGSKRGGRAVAVPSEAAGLALALQRFGKLGTAAVSAPATRLAREGFTVEPHLARSIERYREAIAADPALAKELLHDDGSPYEAGEVLKRPALARSLELFGESGASPFQRGEIAAAIVAAVAASGGAMTAEDLSGYEPLKRPATIVRFKEWEILGMPPPSSGGGVIGEVLGVLEPYDLISLRRNSVTYMHLLGETFKAAFADRAALYGDPAYHPVPLDRLLSASNADRIRSGISAVRAAPPSQWGRVVTRDDAGTSHISVIDADGNAVACTSSINTAFGAKVGVPGYGLLLNNTMDDFSLQPGVPNAYGLVGSEANSIEGGKRPLSSMSPTIVLRDGRARLAVGASGGPLIITGTLQTMLNTLVFDLDVDRAVKSPRLHNQWMPDMLGLEKGIPEIRRDALGRRGHNVKVFDRGAAVQAVEIVEQDGRRTVRAASDERKGGMAAAQSSAGD